MYVGIGIGRYMYNQYNIFLYYLHSNQYLLPVTVCDISKEVITLVISLIYFFIKYLFK